MAPPILLIHGIWQAAPIVDIFTKLPLLAERVEIRFRQDDAPLDGVLDAMDPTEAARVIAVFQQVTDPGATPPKLRPARLAPGAPWVRFPLLVMECFWPLRGPEPRLVPEPPLYPDGRYPMTDTIAAAMAGMAASDEAIYAEYRRRSAEAMPDVEAALIRDIQMIAARDLVCDVRVLRFAMDTLAREKLFHQPYAPAGPIVAHVARGLGAHLAPALGIEPATMARALARFTQGMTGIGHEQTPVHPEVGRILGLEWCDDSTPYRHYKNSWTFRDYILRYIAWADWAR